MMMRAIFILTAVLGWCGKPSAQQQVCPTPRPSFVLLIWDDTDPDHMGLVLDNGSTTRKVTPTLDQLNQLSVVFPNGQSMSRCGPSAARLLTGRECLNLDNRVCWNGGPDDLLNPAQTIAHEIKAIDPCYRTFGQGKVASPAITLTDLGFDDGCRNAEFWRREIGCSSRECAVDTDNPFEEIEGFLDSLTASEPFFMWLLPNMPHEPWDDDCNPFNNAFNVYKGEHLDDLEPPALNASDRLAWEDRFIEQIEMTRWVDERLKVLLQVLGARGRLDNTWVINVFGDNGYADGYVGKGSPYEKGVRAPISFFHEDLQTAGRVHNLPVSTLDVPATILHLADGQDPPPEVLQERSLTHFFECFDPIEDPTYCQRQFLTGQRNTIYSAAFVQPASGCPDPPDICTADDVSPFDDVLALYATGMMGGALNQRVKYILWMRDVSPTEAAALGIKHQFTDFGEKFLGQEEFYLVNENQDPFEQDNLACTPLAPRAVLDTFRDACLQWWTDAGGDPPLVLDPSVFCQ
jgi:hypothetical protein